MAIVRLQHVGIVVRDFEASCQRFERVLGLKPRDFRNDQGKGMQFDSRVLVGNDCWIHIVHNWNPESRVCKFLERVGEGLEHIALETDDIEADVGRLRRLKVPVFEDTIFNANDGYEAFVYPSDGIGFTVELIQPHSVSWGYPPDARGRPLSERMGLVRLQRVGAVVRDPRAAADRFARLFGLPVRDLQDHPRQHGARVMFGNECWLQLVESRDPQSRISWFMHARGEGLEHAAFETRTLDADLQHFDQVEVPYARELDDQDRAWVSSADGVGFTVELVQVPPTVGAG